ncbi:MAG: DedA family protein [Planctomycetes bacterium]|nr:DedA family protein [Planctomycetota bacterium]
MKCSFHIACLAAVFFFFAAMGTSAISPAELAVHQGQAPAASPPPAVANPQAPSDEHQGGAPAPQMPKWIAEGIDRYGAITVFFAFIISGVGLHLSEDLILIPAGWISANDPRFFWELALAAYAGIVLGDLGWFLMCRTFGTRIVHSRFFKRMFHPRRLLEVKHQIDQRGVVVLIAARFIPGTRTPVITMCGVLHMATWKFMLVEGICVLFSAPLQMAIGWLAFHAAAKAGVTDIFHQIMVAVGVTLAVVIGLWLVHKAIDRRKSKRHPPRAKVAWLRTFRVEAKASSAG